MSEYYEIIAYSDVYLQQPSQAESNLGNLVTDAMRNGWDNADIALINDGGIRNSIADGDITKEDILNVFTETVKKFQIAEFNRFYLLPILMTGASSKAQIWSMKWKGS